MPVLVLNAVCTLLLDLRTLSMITVCRKQEEVEDVVVSSLSLTTCRLDVVTASWPFLNVPDGFLKFPDGLLHCAIVVW